MNDCLTNKLYYPVFYTSPKGMGKTLHIMKVLNRIVVETELTPSLILFKELGYPFLLNPLKLAREGEWGDRLKKYDDISDMSQVLENSDIIVLDDMHYFIEANAENRISEEEIYLILKSLIQQSDKNKQIMVLSESPLNIYADILDLRKIDELLPDLGLPLVTTTEKRANYYRGKIKRELNFVGSRELIPITLSTYVDITHALGADLDDIGMEVIYKIGSRPRNLIRFLNLFDTNNITYNMILTYAANHLKKHHQPSKWRETCLESLKIIDDKLPLSPKTVLYLRDNQESTIPVFDAVSKICDQLAIKIDQEVSKFRNNKPSPLTRALSLKKDFYWLKDHSFYPRQDWNSHPHIRLKWARINVPSWFDRILRNRMEEEALKSIRHYGYGDKKILADYYERLLKTYFEDTMAVRYLKRYLESPLSDESKYPYSYLRSLTEEYRPMEALEFVFKPLIVDVETVNLISMDQSDLLEPPQFKERKRGKTDTLIDEFLSTGYEKHEIKTDHTSIYNAQQIIRRKLLQRNLLDIHATVIGGKLFLKREQDNQIT